MKNIILTLILTVFTFSLATTAKAQSEWTFVVLESAVSSDATPTSSDNPNERRFYISNVVQTPNNMRSYQVPKAFDKYFTENLVDPMKAKGINVKYYDSDFQINCGSVLAVESRQDAEEKRAKCLESIKDRGDLNIYSFNWTFGPAKGLETVNPILIFRGKNAPNYLPAGEKPEIVSNSATSSQPIETTPVKPPKKVKKPKNN